jgi:hypothetical protein
MRDDWRVTATLEHGLGHGLGALLREHVLEDEVGAFVGDRVAVSADATHVFLYAGTRWGAEEAQRAVAAILEQDGRPASFALHRWHPIEEEWEEADAPLPADAEGREQEREHLDAEETAESVASGHAEWEVRLDLPGHDEAVELARRLESEGVPTTRRWTYLLAGAGNRDEAQQLAQRLKAEAPAGTEIHVQPGGEMAWEVTPANPFAVFGGLGG